MLGMKILTADEMRTADRLTMADSREDLNMIPFDLHASAAAVTALTAFQFIIDEVEVDAEMRRDSFNRLTRR